MHAEVGSGRQWAARRQRGGRSDVAAGWACAAQRSAAQHGAAQHAQQRTLTLGTWSCTSTCPWSLRPPFCRGGRAGQVGTAGQGGRPGLEACRAVACATCGATGGGRAWAPRTLPPTPLSVPALAQQTDFRTHDKPTAHKPTFSMNAITSLCPMLRAQCQGLRKREERCETLVRAQQGSCGPRSETSTRHPGTHASLHGPPTGRLRCCWR